MCQSQNEQLLRDAIAAKVQAGEPFTAFDITQAARAAGATEAHYQMKNAVHAMYSNGEMPGYDRTNIQTPTGGAWCYYPMGEPQKPADYMAALASGQPYVPSSPVASPAPASASPATATVAAGTSVDERKTATDKDGRLPIWSDMLRNIGATPGNMVTVVHNGGYLSVVRAQSGMHVPVADYMVNADGRVRINSGVLSPIFSATSTYNVKLDAANERIEITAL